MATQKIKTTIIPRKDTYANWTATTAKVLAAGEFGLDTTNNVLKCGDGTSTWANLPELNETTLSDLGITATAAEINKLDGLTATTAELNYVDGVTSAIQTQLNNKAPKSHATSATTYGVATTSNYGHVKISNGDVATVNSANGVAAGMDHSHSNYAPTSHTHAEYENTVEYDGLMADYMAILQGASSVRRQLTADEVDLFTQMYENPNFNVISSSVTTAEGLEGSVHTYRSMTHNLDGDYSLDLYTQIGEHFITIYVNFNNNDIYMWLANMENVNAVPGIRSDLTKLEKTVSGLKYAGSSSAGGAATSANKVNKSLKVQLNSGTTEGTSQFTFDGSTAKTVNITPSSIGASASGHTHSSYVNQNAFSNVKVGSTTVAADTTTDTLELVAGTNVTITPDATNDKITISATDTVYTHPSTHAASMITGLATVATSGSYNDLSNKPTIPTVNNGTLTIQGNGTAASTFTANQSGNTTLNIKGSGGTTVTKSANNEITISTGTIPTGAAASKGVDTSISAASTSTNLPTSKAVAAFVEGKGYKTTDYNQTIKSGTTTFGVNDAVEIVAGTNVTVTPDATNKKITISSTNTTYNNATTSAAGLMSAADKTKLNGIASGATANKGTVTSVTIKAGTGLTSSSTSAITTSGERTISIASGYKLPTTTEWDNKVEKTYTSGGITNSIVNGDNGIWLESGINYITVDPDVISMGVNDSNFVEIYDSGMTIDGDIDAANIYSTKVSASDGTAIAEIGIGLNSIDDEATLSLKNSSSQYLTISGSGTFYKGSYSAALPLKSGTIALTSDIPTSIAWTSVTGKPSTFTPPTATSNVLGGVKTSTGITNSSGTISVAYGTTAGTACQGNDSRLSDSRTPKAHNQASNTINAMTGYTKASAASAISTSDSLNTAIGKLEKALDGKGTSNLTLGTTSTTAAKGNHTHDYSSTYAAKSHTHDYLSTSGGTLTNSSSGNAILTLTNGSYQPKLTFSASGGGHNPTISLAPYASGSTTGSYTVYLPAKNGTLATTDDLSNRAVLFSENKGSGGIMVSATQNSIESSDYTIGTGETFSDATKNEIPTKGAISSYLGNNFASKSHTHSSYANQNAFSNVKVVKSGGGTSDVTVAADTTTDTVSFEGNNITITGDATNDKVTFSLTKTNVTTALGYTPPTTNTTYSDATTSASGLMSAADKTKLNGIATGATANKGTVTSVRVQAGTGLSSSVSTAQTGSLNTTISIASGYKLPTSTEWSDVMKKSGNETAMGLKTFYDGITFGTWEGTIGGDNFGGELIDSPAGSIILVESESDSILIGVTTDGNLALTNLSAPTNDKDAATKYYVDQTVDDAKPSVVGANGTTGLIKNGSAVTSTSGLTACPIISGVPYYKDTNTQSAYGNVTTSGTITAAAVKTASGVVVVDSSNKIQKVTSMSDFRTIIGAGTSNLAIGTTSSTAAAGNHTHKYAGSSSAGGAANSVKTNLTIKLNGGSVEGTSLFTFNGSTAKTINITPAAIGALSTNAADDSDTWGETTTSKLPTKRSVAAYTNANFAEKGHKHTASLATDTGTSAITLGHGGKYKLTAGGSSVIFTMPSATYLATKLAASTGIAGGSSESDNTGYLPILKNALNSTSENSVCYLASGMSTYAEATKMKFGNLIGNIGGVMLGDSSGTSHNICVSGFVVNQTPTSAMQHMPLAMWADPTNTYSAGLGLNNISNIILGTRDYTLKVRNIEAAVTDPGTYDGYAFTFPQKNGTVALTSDIPTFKTINGNTITGSGDIEISSASDLSFYEGDIGTVNKHPEDIWATHINAIDYMEVRSDNQSFISNAVLDSTGDGEDIDTIYCSNGIKMTDGNSDDVFELAFPAKSGVLSLKGHTHTVSCVGSIDYGIYHKTSALYSSDGTFASSYCNSTYATSKIFADIDNFGVSTATYIKVQVYSETNALLKTIEVTGRRLQQWIPNWVDYHNNGAMGADNYTLLFEKFNDTDFWCAGMMYTATSSNSATRVSRVTITYGDPGDSGMIMLQEIATKKTLVSSKTSGGSNY